MMSLRKQSIGGIVPLIRRASIAIGLAVTAALLLPVGESFSPSPRPVEQPLQRSRHHCAMCPASRPNRSNEWPLSRIHERCLFFVYSLAGSAVLTLQPTTSRAEAAVAVTWTTMVLAISFTEAWVKFRAPFLPKYIAVDVGRHVFAAKQAIELGLSTAFLGSWCCGRKHHLGPSIPIFPTVATIALWLEAWIISPRLYRRAKYKIVKEISKDDAFLQGNERAQRELTQLVKDVNQKDFVLPSTVWHSAYGVIELVKVVCLGAFALRAGS